ncbi:MAG: lysophospholipid acyltransferase family protein [Prevotella sp.]|nr:lysophospholipid acyltransferase family protein [Prevotella sp.]MCM1075661.1 lysophospholipid acyltransferase family protein [Ruminococcus sp.]
MNTDNRTEYKADTIDASQIRPDVLNVDDVVEMVPKLAKHRKLVNWLLNFLQVDEVNAVHRRWCDTPGPDFVKRMVEEDFKLKLRVDGQDVLDNLPEGAFVTVSNHPFGALDGITLIYLITRTRPDFKVMVNMILNKITAMRPNFIAVNAWGTKDPEAIRVSMAGVREAITRLKEGHPLGFFPAGTMSKTDWHGRLIDGQWQKSVLQIIGKAKVPVIPIFFHGSNSWWFNFLGHACWPARSLRLPAEVFRKRGKELHISVGKPITVEEQAQFGKDYEALGKLLREHTYALRDEYCKKK